MIAIDVSAPPPVLLCTNPAYYWRAGQLYYAHDDVAVLPREWFLLSQLPSLRVRLPDSWRLPARFPYQSDVGDVFTLTRGGAIGYAGQYDDYSELPPHDDLRDDAQVLEFGCYAEDVLPLLSALEHWEAEH